MTVLSAADVDAFVERGFCVLPGAFTAAQAAAARAVVWRRMEEKAGIRRDDPATWPDSYDIEERPTAPEVLGCFTDRLVAAIARLVGPGRWNGLRTWGFWPVNFAYGAHDPRPVPTHGWHVDGNWFRHTLDAPQQGLLLVGLFSDVEPGGGGTLVAEGSHRRAARVLAAHPAGLTHLELFDAVLAEPIGNITELTGAAGDVVLAHPFLFHTRGFKRHGRPRFISNTEAGLRVPLRLDRPDEADHSVLERSIRAALAGPPPVFTNPLRCRF
ncbi:phytanoyl-CoA dioxygenase family protein [Frankia sp. CNm7]|uniref:Phytanoyl-CoA dioxygenase family protein n=1 Tax=Frankia nepalensis TaxID=1836974 RepID=A0A937UNZ2_9ACTN|nr:phytanoyl-CoA dioxygenase family protein [Frankia nepalensis]MBL7500107.1 phytanoyl-CoA dioxygenase family protein [Frankia nepalensis]MBL7512436.1 phytanoyl-CoA dioxygenase family protein [Frankia nepalensis]MBL7518802.1 phytanoyl-CoA dioxygenase family protein [Frankia nepalensis]MBL7628573.1 phytanoyl-CoA dioxygenase family protein [Frankia nepalensis]